jgi:hypothetical protein
MQRRLQNYYIMHEFPNLITFVYGRNGRKITFCITAQCSRKEMRIKLLTFVNHNLFLERTSYCNVL